MWFVVVVLCVSVASHLFYLVVVLVTESVVFFFLMIRRPPRSTLDRSSAASDVYKRQEFERIVRCPTCGGDSVYSPKNEARPFCSVRCKSVCLLYTSPSPRDRTRSRMPSSA